MKTKCLKKYLQKALLLSEKISSNNPTLPILSSVLISTNKNSLIFSTTNLEMALKVSVSAKVEKEGKLALPSKLFSNLISSLPDSTEIELTSVDNNLIITTNISSTTIKGFPVEDFPILPNIKEKQIFNISVNDFIPSLKSVYYATSNSEMKPEINSVYLKSSKGVPTTFVATDTFRLAEKIIPYNFSGFSGILIPYKSAIEILRIFENEEGDLTIKIDENNLVLQNNNIEFLTRLIDGNFLDYKQIIPTDFSNIVTIYKKDLISSLKSAAMFCGKLNEIRLKIYKDEDYIELQTNNPDLGEHVINIKGETSGDDLVSVFNYRYLVDCLSSFNSEKIVFKFDGEKPFLITGLDDTSFRYLIMPMKNL